MCMCSLTLPSPPPHTHTGAGGGSGPGSSSHVQSGLGRPPAACRTSTPGGTHQPLCQAGTAERSQPKLEVCAHINGLRCWAPAPASVQNVKCVCRQAWRAAELWHRLHAVHVADSKLVRAGSSCQGALSSVLSGMLAAPPVATGRHAACVCMHRTIRVRGSADLLAWPALGGSAEFQSGRVVCNGLLCCCPCIWLTPKQSQYVWINLYFITCALP